MKKNNLLFSLFLSFFLFFSLFDYALSDVNKKKAIFIKISKFNPGKTYIEITATHVN